MGVILMLLKYKYEFSKVDIEFM